MLDEWPVIVCPGETFSVEDIFGDFIQDPTSWLKGGEPPFKAAVANQHVNVSQHAIEVLLLKLGAGDLRHTCPVDPDV